MTSPALALSTAAWIESSARTTASGVGPPESPALSGGIFRCACRFSCVTGFYAHRRSRTAVLRVDESSGSTVSETPVPGRLSTLEPQDPESRLVSRVINYTRHRM